MGTASAASVIQEPLSCWAESCRFPQVERGEEKQEHHAPVSSFPGSVGGSVDVLRPEAEPLTAYLT